VKRRLRGFLRVIFVVTLSVVFIGGLSAVWAADEGLPEHLSEELEKVFEGALQGVFNQAI
jgi:hypothetical protein